jgi:hypothetical protein
MNRAAAFNPAAFLDATPAETSPPAAHGSGGDINRPLPMEWERGLIRLREMPVPRGATTWRWQQVVADAVAFAPRWHVVAQYLGWSIGNLFGFHPNEPLGRLGLVLDIRGGLVTHLDDDVATVTRDGEKFFFSRGMPDDSQPLWLLRTIER